MMMQMQPETPETPDKKTAYLVPLLELAVPVLSFGSVALAMLLSALGMAIEIRYFATGCILGSCILAYLAWIRPQKDIVALTTPLYSFLFFVLPSDFAVDLVLELLYAVSLTILLVRLKMRFGTAPESGVREGKVLVEPVKGYCESMRDQVSGMSPGLAHHAAVGFTRFAQGDYREAVEAADAARADPGYDELLPALRTAFEIVREQAEMFDTSGQQPESFREFSATDISLLAKPVPPEEKVSARFEVSLENALLLLFAAAWNASERDQSLLLYGQDFARKLLAP
jgi:hypothetical protein